MSLTGRKCSEEKLLEVTSDLDLEDNWSQLVSRGTKGKIMCLRTEVRKHKMQSEIHKQFSTAGDYSIYKRVRGESRRGVRQRSNRRMPRHLELTFQRIGSHWKIFKQGNDVIMLFQIISTTVARVDQRKGESEGMEII